MSSDNPLSDIAEGAIKVSDIIRKSITITDASSPSIFVIAGAKSVVKILQDSVDQLKIALKEYELERVTGGDKEILFFKRKI